MMSSEYDSYLRSETWATLRHRQIQLDGGRCRCCGVRERLECHHVYDGTDRFAYPKPLGSEIVGEDLITLCCDCHEAITESVRMRRSGSSTKRSTPVKKAETRPVERLPYIEGEGLSSYFARMNARN